MLIHHHHFVEILMGDRFLKSCMLALCFFLFSNLPSSRQLALITLLNCVPAASSLPKTKGGRNTTILRPPKEINT